MKRKLEIRAPALVEETPALDSFSMKDERVFIRMDGEIKASVPFIDYGDYIEIKMKDGDKIEIDMEVYQLKYAKQHFFVCPKCRKRQRFLYFVFREYILECRTCGYLQYHSRLSWDCFDYYNAGMKYIREKLGYNDTDTYPEMFPNIVPDKPKGMKVAVYERHLAKLRWYQDKYKTLSDETVRKILKKCEKKKGDNENE